MQRRFLLLYTKKKADDRTRTDNLLITSQLLCQLSHIGVTRLLSTCLYYHQTFHSSTPFFIFFKKILKSIVKCRKDTFP